MSYPYQIKTAEEYRQAYQKSVADPEGFWADIAGNFQWRRPWDKVLEWNFTEPRVRWFSGGQLNITENCLDRHLADKGDKPAIIWEPNNPDEDYRNQQLESFKNNLMPLQGAIELIGDGTEVAPGLTAIATPGHTPGHMGLKVESGSDTLWLLGDVALHSLQLQYPDFTGMFDADPDQKRVGRVNPPLPAAEIFHLDRFKTVPAENFSDPGFHQDFDFRIGQDPFDEFAPRAKIPPPVNERHIRCRLSQKQRIFKRRVTAADNQRIFIFEPRTLIFTRFDQAAPTELFLARDI